MGLIANSFNAEVDRVNSIGFWRNADHKPETEATEKMMACFARAPLEEQRVLRKTAGMLLRSYRDGNLGARMEHGEGRHLRRRVLVSVSLRRFAV